MKMNVATSSSVPLLSGQLINRVVSSLVDLSCSVVSCSLTWGELESKCVGGVIPLPVIEKYVFHAFPGEEEVAKCVVAMWEGEGMFDLGEWEVRGDDVVQIGMTLVGGVRRRRIEEEDEGVWYEVEVSFERRRLVGVVCGCGGGVGTFFCGHVVALCVLRARMPELVEVKAPVSETLGMLSRGQLQGVVQEMMMMLRMGEESSVGAASLGRVVVGGVLLRAVQCLAEKVLLRGGGVKNKGGAPDVSICWGDEPVVDPLRGVAEMLRGEFDSNSRSGSGRYCVSKSSSSSCVPFLLRKVKLLLRVDGCVGESGRASRLVGVVRDEMMIKNGGIMSRCCVQGECPVGEELSDLVDTLLLFDEKVGVIDGLARGVWLSELSKCDNSSISIVERAAVGVVEALRMSGEGLSLRWAARVGGVLLKCGKVGAALELCARCFTQNFVAGRSSTVEVVMRGEDRLLVGVVRVGLDQLAAHRREEFLELMEEGVSFPFFELGRLLLEYFGGRALSAVIRLFSVSVQGEEEVTSQRMMLSLRGVRLLEDVVNVMIREEVFDMVDELVMAVDNGGCGGGGGCGLLSVVGVVGVCRRTRDDAALANRISVRRVLVPLGVWLLRKTIRQLQVTRDAAAEVRLRMEVVMLVVGMVSDDEVVLELLGRWEELFTEEEVVGVVATRVLAAAAAAAGGGTQQRIVGKVRDVALEVLRRGQCSSVLLGALGVVLLTADKNNNNSEEAVCVLRGRSLTAAASHEVRGYLLARGISMETK